jgi:hypothetical protein
MGGPRVRPCALTQRAQRPGPTHPTALPRAADLLLYRSLQQLAKRSGIGCLDFSAPRSGECASWNSSGGEGAGAPCSAPEPGCLRCRPCSRRDNLVRAVDERPGSDRRARRTCGRLRRPCSMQLIRTGGRAPAPGERRRRRLSVGGDRDRRQTGDEEQPPRDRPAATIGSSRGAQMHRHTIANAVRG